MPEERIFQRELCDLAEAYRKLQYRRALLMAEDADTRARLAEEERLLAYVCGETSITEVEEQTS